MKARLFFTIAFLGLLASSYADEDLRVWTNARGQKIKAALVEIKETTVILKSATSGRELEIAISNLSHTDQVYLQQQRAGQDGAKSGSPDQQAVPPEQRSYTQEQIDQIRDYDLLELYQQFPQIPPDQVIQIEFDRVDNLGALDEKEECYWAFLGDSEHHVELKDKLVGLVVCGDEGKQLLDKWRKRTERTKHRSEKADSMELLCVILPKGHEKRTELKDYELVLMALGQDSRRDAGGTFRLVW